MSHFTTMVFCEEDTINPEELLAPYDESEEMDPYEVGPVDEGDLDLFEKEFRNETNKDLTLKELYDAHGGEWNYNNWVFESDNEAVEYSTYNPNSKWDWYSLGGRWIGYFKLKEGAKPLRVGETGAYHNSKEGLKGRADAAYKKDIDIEGMINEVLEESLPRYDKIRDFIDKSGLEYKPISEFENNEEYREQPIFKLLSDQKDPELISACFDPDVFTKTREEYIEDITKTSFLPFSFISTEGEWFESGEMGWWAIVKDEKNVDEWHRIFFEHWNNLPDDAVIYLYDLHI